MQSRWKSNKPSLTLSNIAQSSKVLARQKNHKSTLNLFNQQNEDSALHSRHYSQPNNSTNLQSLLSPKYDKYVNQSYFSTKNSKSKVIGKQVSQQIEEPNKMQKLQLIYLNANRFNGNSTNQRKIFQNKSLTKIKLIKHIANNQSFAINQKENQRGNISLNGYAKRQNFKIRTSIIHQHNKTHIKSEASDTSKQLSFCFPQQNNFDSLTLLNNNQRSKTAFSFESFSKQETKEKQSSQQSLSQLLLIMNEKQIQINNKRRAILDQQETLQKLKKQISLLKSVEQKNKFLSIEVQKTQKQIKRVEGYSSNKSLTLQNTSNTQSSSSLISSIASPSNANKAGFELNQSDHLVSQSVNGLDNMLKRVKQFISNIEYTKSMKFRKIRFIRKKMPSF